MTPHELNLHIHAYSERMRLESENNITSAYLTAYWQRVKRMPNLQNILKKTQPKKHQSPEEILAMVKKLNTKTGGKTT